MARQSQVASVQSDENRLHRLKPESADELGAPTFGPGETLSGPMARLAGAAIRPQVSKLADGWMQGAQRRALARQIGRHPRWSGRWWLHRT